MILEILTICSLLQGGGFDCSEQWDIYIHDDPRVTQFCNNVERGTGEGCYWKYYNGQRVVTEVHISLPGQHGKDLWGNTVLWHELQHAICACDWH